MRLLVVSLLVAPTVALAPATVAPHGSQIVLSGLSTSRRARSPCASAEASDAAPATAVPSLALYESMDAEGKATIDGALQQRNKMRVLSGLPRYESLADFVRAYMEYEGKEKGISEEEAEREVLQFLQKLAIMDEGGADFKDPQTIVTFALLAALLVGIGSSLTQNGI